MHDFSESLDRGQMGELFFRYWLEKRYPGLEMDAVDLATDLRGIDGFVRCEPHPVQIKFDERAHETGNVFVETLADVERDKPGWALKCDASVIWYLVPGAGLLFHVRPGDIAALVPQWQSRYTERDVPNRSWTTRGILVPIAEFRRHFFCERDEALANYSTEAA